MSTWNRPGQRCCFVTVCLVLIATPPVARAQSQPAAAAEPLPVLLNIAWQRGPNLPHGFQDSDGGIVDGTLVTACGFCSGQNNVAGKPTTYPRGFFNKVWGLDLRSPGAKWSALPDLPGAARQENFAIVVDGRLYTWGGFSYTEPYCYADGFRLSRENDQWKWEPLPPLPWALGSAGVAAIGSKIYAAGGTDYDLNKFYTHADRAGKNPRLGARLLVLDTAKLSDGWKELPACPGTPRWVAATAAVGGKLYVIGGATGNDNPTGSYCTVVDNWLFDPEKSAWTRLPDLPVASGNFPSGQIVFADRYIMLVGGAQYGNVLGPDGQVRKAYGKPTKHYPEKDYFSDVFVFDTRTNRFGTATPLPLNNNLPMTLVEGNRIHLVGGETAGSVFDGEHYGHHPDLYLVGTITKAAPGTAAGGEAGAIDIGNRLELFADGLLVDRLQGAELRLHSPEPQGVALDCRQPWEGNASGYAAVFQDGDLYRMYYRGLHALRGEEATHEDVVCYAESRDGIQWTKPNLGLVEFAGSKANNIIWKGVGAGNFAPFKDSNPQCKPDERYKALGGDPNVGGLHALASADGLHWRTLNDKAVITIGAFDSHNLPFWDPVHGEYREYHRGFREGRDILTCTSKDFRQWTEPAWIEYTPGRISELYTNQILPYYRAPHILLGFPTRYYDRGWVPGTASLPQAEFRRVRGSKSPREGSAVTDGMFMAGRDRKNFTMWPESFIRPGLRVRDNWFYGDNYQAWGLVETQSPIEGGTRELSLYATEAYAQDDKGTRFRRYSLRIDGFVSVKAPLKGGELITRPIRFSGSELVLNLSTGAAGGAQVEIQDASGRPIEGYTLADCPEIFGDFLERVVAWKSGASVKQLAGRPVRLRFLLKDADLYSLRFR